MRSRLLAATIAAAATLAATSRAQELPVVGEFRAHSHSVRKVLPASQQLPRLVDDHIVRMAGSSWIRLEFADVELGEDSRLEIRSLRDGQMQVFDRYRHDAHSAFFNGDAVRVRLFAGAGTSSYRIQGAFVNTTRVSGPQTLCGADDRTVSSDKRCARLLVRVGNTLSVCTAFLISEWHCFATSGLCLKTRPNSVTVQFNVPASAATGTIRHPAVQDQYVWTGTYAFESAGWGKDWGVFTTKKNSTTGRYPGQVQGAYYRLSTTGNPGLRATLLATGHGLDTSPRTRNHIQQRAVGPVRGIVSDQLRYAIDTRTGSEGSPVHSTSGLVYAIHTHGACHLSQFGFNVGTRVSRASFKTWVARLCRKPAEPDLVAEAMQVNSGGKLTAAQRYVFQSRIRNAGGAASPATTSGYFLSSNATISTSDLLVSSFTTKALAVDALHVHSATVQMPRTLAPDASCWPGVIADRRRSLVELFENNNAKAGQQVECVNPFPDFVVDQFQSNKTVIWETMRVALQARVGNAGYVAVGPAQHGFYLSTDATISTGDTLLGNVSTATMLPNTAQIVQTEVTIPRLGQFGKCWLGFVADSAGTTAEVRETNNTASLEVKCDRQPLPDFGIDSLTASSKRWETGKSFQATTVIKNSGTSPSSTTQAAYVMSKDRTINLQDKLLATFVVQSLPPGLKFKNSMSITPSRVGSGTCYFGVVADSLNLVAESDEGNNTASVVGTCVDRSDLVIDQFSFEARTSFPAGSVLKITITTKNIGNAESEAESTTATYLSTNNVISTSDIFLGSHSVPIIDPDMSSVILQDVQLPYTTVPGNYFLGGIADVTGQLAELNEANNTRFGSIDIAAYLGTERWVEWVGPRLDNTNGPFTTMDARFPANSAFAAQVRMLAPTDAGQPYVLVWSGTAPIFSLDAWADFSLTFVNTPLFPGWAGVIAADGTASASLNVPLPGLPGATIHTHFAILGPTISFGSNQLRMDIDP